MSRKSIAVVRFAAVDVLALVDLARDNRMDALWFTCGKKCLLQLPDCAHEIEPEEVEGNTEVVYDRKAMFPRVEVIELHNYVLGKLCSRAGHLTCNTKLEIHFNDTDEFCLVLCEWCKPSVRSHGPRFLSDVFGGL